MIFGSLMELISFVDLPCSLILEGTASVGFFESILTLFLMATTTTTTTTIIIIILMEEYFGVNQNSVTLQ